MFWFFCTFWWVVWMIHWEWSIPICIFRTPSISLMQSHCPCSLTGGVCQFVLCMHLRLFVFYCISFHTTILHCVFLNKLSAASLYYYMGTRIDRTYRWIVCYECFRHWLFLEDLPASNVFHYLLFSVTSLVTSTILIVIEQISWVIIHITRKRVSIKCYHVFVRDWLPCRVISLSMGSVSLVNIFFLLHFWMYLLKNFDIYFDVYLIIFIWWTIYIVNRLWDVVATQIRLTKK